MRLVLCLLLTLSTSLAWAEWVKVSVTDEHTTYIDPATIRKDGNLRKVWTIQDRKQRDKDGEMSRRTLIEYDCKEERYRVRSGTTHSDPMARGNTLYTRSGEPGEWNDIPPETPPDGSGAASRLGVSLPPSWGLRGCGAFAPGTQRLPALFDLCQTLQINFLLREQNRPSLIKDFSRRLGSIHGFNS